ncbi:hypothetical protein CWO90_32565 [Bradyrhizobium sp. Leo121]|nr:hypothetical protein [Bradyrhizobium sp. Leo121]RZN21950.1 hypothetical protein CWO90_32565 [Bradyrhizobium sp. Leo121]
MPWSTAFQSPIPVPGRKPIETLREAGQYIASLPKSEQENPHWQAACEALILVAERGGDTNLARIGMLRALNHGEPKTFTKRRKPVKRYRIIP